jgi:dihydroorotate dehydrogenase
MGGGDILTLKDALEFIISGTGAVSVGTANFVNVNVCVENRRWH